jgi:hypothetical protein
MTESQKIPWKRIGIEASAIVASILLAFAIDAWWDERREQEDVRRTLQAILEDFHASKEAVTWGRTASTARRQSIVKLIEVTNDSSSKLNDTALDRLLSDLGWFQDRMIINDGSLNSLIASGKIGAINNAELRGNLAGWSRNNDELRAMLSQDKKYLEDLWWPFIREHGYQPQIQRAVRHFPGHPTDTWIAFPLEPSERFDHSILLSERRFHNVLAELWSVQNDMLLAYDRADNWLDRSIELIEEELSK